MTERSSSGLDLEISFARMSVSSDGYPMSIGELTNMYKEGELIIRPAFQRFFRWSEVQKSNLIESIILGIPIPSIFVAQNEDGVWELVDGLQRVSTILELQGELLDENQIKKPPLKLTQTKYLPSLEGCYWDGPTEETSLSSAHRLDFKRAKIDVKIIKRASSKDSKYDLFQRINNYGSRLSAQEMRSALLVAVSPEFFGWLEDLSSLDTFREVVQLSERLLDERYDLELILRFFVLHNYSEGALRSSYLRDFSQVLDNKSVETATDFPSNRYDLERVFRNSFNIMYHNGGSDIFRKWDPARLEFRGAFLNTAFEIFGLGVGYNVANNKLIVPDLLKVIKEFWELPEMRSGFATGKSTEWRLSTYIPIGRKLTCM